MSKYNNKIALLCHQLVQLERSAFFGAEDIAKWLPHHQQDDARVMCPPCVGPNYRTGGLLILSISPGGGNEARHSGDIGLYPLLHEFKGLKKGRAADFYQQRFVPGFITAMRDWKVYKDIEKLFETAGSGPKDIGYCNLVPYRCRGNEYPTSSSDMEKIIPNCISKYMKPLLMELKPSLVIAFSKQVETYISKYWSDFPRQTTELLTWNRARVATDKVKADRKACLARLRAWRDS